MLPCTAPYPLIRGISLLDLSGIALYLQPSKRVKTGKQGRNSTHNPKVLGSNPSPATNLFKGLRIFRNPFFFLRYRYVTKTNFSFIFLR